MAHVFSYLAFDFSINRMEKLMEEQEEEGVNIKIKSEF